MAPHPIAKKHAKANLLPGLALVELTISNTIGNIIAATACSDIKNALNDDKKNIDSKILCLLVPNLEIKFTDILELSPDRIIGLAKTMADKTKNTVLLANSLYVLVTFIAPDRGNNIIPNNPGIARGKILHIHKKEQVQKTASALCA